jgi:hypothetical protein
MISRILLLALLVACNDAPSAPDASPDAPPADCPDATPLDAAPCGPCDFGENCCEGTCRVGSCASVCVGWKDWGNLFQDWKPREISFQPEDMLPKGYREIAVFATMEDPDAR